MLSAATISVTLMISQSAGNEVYEEFVGVRSSSMGSAHRGLGTSNDTLYLNPAGMAITQRYSIDAIYGYSKLNDLNRFNASIVDSKSGRIAGGVGLTHTRGDEAGLDPRLNRFHGALAYAITPELALGLNVKHLRGSLATLPAPIVPDEHNEVRVWNGDIGVMLRLGSVGLGLVYQNALNVDDNDKLFTPRTFGGGVGFSQSNVTLTGDVVAERRDDSTELSFGLGGEYFVLDAIALRLGYRLAPVAENTTTANDENIISGGFGYITRKGAIDLGALQSLDRNENWQLIGSLRLFL